MAHSLTRSLASSKRAKKCFEMSNVVEDAKNEAEENEEETTKNSFKSCTRFESQNGPPQPMRQMSPNSILG